MAPPSRMRWLMLAAVVSWSGCGGHGAGRADAGRDAPSDEAEIVIVIPGSDGGGGDLADAADAVSEDAPADAEADAADGGEDTPPDAGAGVDAGTDAGTDGPFALDAPPADLVPEAARDVAPHEVAPPHDTRPKYLGSYAPTTMGSAVPAVGPDGSIYVAGWFGQTTDFDPGPGQDVRDPVGDTDAFVTKLGPDGSILWTKTFGGPRSRTQAMALTVTDKALVIVGGYSNEVDFDPGEGVQNRLEGSLIDESGFVLQLTTAGDFVWVSTFTGTGECQANGVALDADGSVYAAGDFSGFCDLDPGDADDEHMSHGNVNGYLVKLGAADGHAVWAKSFDGDNCVATFASVTTSSDGLVWATGELAAACSLDGQTAPAGTSDTAVAIAAFTPDGAPGGLWSINGGDGVSIAGSPDGFVYVAGTLVGVSSTDFDPGPGVVSRTLSPGDNDQTGFVVKLGPGAAFQWVQTTSRIWTVALAATDDGGVLWLGQPVADTQQTVAFTVTKRDPSGSSPWGLMLPGTGAAPLGVAAGSSTFVVTGLTSGLMDLDPGSTVDAVAGQVSFASRYSF